ncbi:MAG: hypothetical protein KC478_08705, partial [Bacteriovoracaceae bacterium]|nr:hypothetical protein [Bacteriovoracaceae bacterium]
MLEQTYENVDNVPGDVLANMATKLAVQSDQCEARLGGFQKQWFLDHKSKGQVCNLGYAIRIKAKIDPTKLHKAFLKVLETHPALRLSITDENNQKITDMDIVSKYFYIQFMEPKNLDAAKRDMELVSREVLDISVAPAMSVKLYRLNEDDH